MSNEIVLYAMTQRGLAAVRAILEEVGSEPVAGLVIGRDASLLEDHAEALATLAEQHGVRWVHRGQGPEPQAPHGLAVGWRWLIDHPGQLIVFHDSLLPRYRGFGPVVSALLNGDPEIGVTALVATERFDRGEIIDQLRTSISYPIKIQAAFEQLLPLYASLAGTVARHIVAGAPLRTTPQPEADATYSLWRDERDFRIDWTATAEHIKRHVDAVGYPYAGAQTCIDGRCHVVHDVDVLPDVRIENRTPGKVLEVLDGCPVVVCGQGLARITRLSEMETGADALPLRKLRTRFE